MKPVDFEGSNVVFAKDQPEYLPLPACKIEGQEGEVISIWKPTFQERIKILFGKNIAISLWTFNKPLTPMRIFLAEYKERR